MWKTIVPSSPAKEITSSLCSISMGIRQLILYLCHPALTWCSSIQASNASTSQLSDVPVQLRVHSLAVDTRTHRVYAPEQEEAGQGVARMLVFEAELPKP